MKKLEYTVRFNTPAFLGDAEQNGRWRTPPFKALLRQWWRVVKARAYSYEHTELRCHGGDFFGNAWLSEGDKKPLHRKSRIAIRLNTWEDGKLNSQGWPGDGMELVKTTRDGKGRVRSDVYLGYDPVLPPSRRENRPSVTIRDAIGTDEEARLQILPERLPKLKPSEQDMRDLRDAIQLMAWFGAVGSRARNGWGSIRLDAAGDTPSVSSMPNPTDDLLKRVGREWTQCLTLN